MLLCYVWLLCSQTLESGLQPFIERLRLHHPSDRSTFLPGGLPLLSIDESLSTSSVLSAESPQDSVVSPLLFAIYLIPPLTFYVAVLYSCLAIVYLAQVYYSASTSPHRSQVGDCVSNSTKSDVRSSELQR